MKLPLRRRVSAATAAGLLLVLCGAGLAGQQAWVWADGRAQSNAAAADLLQDWQAAAPHELPGAQNPAEAQASEQPAAAAAGEGVALLRVPRFGSHWSRVVVEGTDKDALRKGPGHFAGSAPAGGTGNFAVAGHRWGPYGVFLHLDQLRTGDQLVVDTHTLRYTYTVTGTRVVTPDHVEALAPTPWHPGVTPSRASITLISCHPVYANKHRLVVTGELTSTTPLPPR